VRGRGDAGAEQAAGSATDGRQAARGGAILVSRFAVTSLLNYLLGVVLAWILVPAEFGVVATVQAVLLLTGLTLAAGIPWALASRAAGARAEAEQAGVIRLFRTGLLLNTLAGGALAVALLGAEALGLRPIPSGSPLLLVATAVTLPVLSFNAVLAGMLQGNRRFGGLGALQATEVVVKAVVAVVLAGVGGLGADGVALGFLAGACTATAVGLWNLRDLMPGLGPLAASMTFSVSVPFWVGSTAMALLPTADLLGLQLAGVGAGVTVTSLAAYQVCGILARSAFYIGDAMVDAVFPFMARQRGTPRSHAWFMAAARWFPLGLLPLQLVLVLAPAPVLALFFPPDYAGSAGLLRILAVGTMGMIAGGMLVKALYANDLAALVAPRAGIAAGVEVVGIGLLVPRLGAVGAALAFGLGSWVAAVLLGVAYLRSQQVVLPPTRIWLRYAPALACCVTLLLVAQQQDRNLLAAAGLILLALAAFVAVASAGNLIPPRDLLRAGRSLVAAGRSIGRLVGRAD
jgi:O-antigen/teichoic acid export membrane protein